MRYAKGGAQELFGIIPDLCVLGKGWVMDILCQHCLVRKKLWRCVLRFSFQALLEVKRLSLAAAKQVLTMVRDCEVLEKINDTGEKIISGVEKIILDNGLEKLYQYLVIQVGHLLQ